MNETETPETEEAAAAASNAVDQTEDVQAEDAGTETAEKTIEERFVEVEAEAAELKNQLLRALAETENIRKRAERQVSEERVYAIERFARDLLAVSDNMGRALDTISEDQRAALDETGKGILSGVELTQKELHAVLARHGVTAIDALPGTTFDPNDHQAVSQIPSDQPAGSVAETFQTGWKIGSRTLRAAMVAVSAGPPKTE